jgi:hypothetical protein
VVVVVVVVVVAATPNYLRQASQNLGKYVHRGCVARQPGATTTLKPTSTFKRAVYHA